MTYATAPCKTCGEPIIFASTIDADRPVPLDPQTQVYHRVAFVAALVWGPQP